MARDLRPKHKIIRHFGENILDTEKNPLIKRNYPPGMHGAKGKGRQSEFGRQLMEKQKAKVMYGTLERQFRKYYEKAVNQKGNSAENLLKILELRLDNIVYRLNFAQTRRQARQLVTHKHILVNGKSVNIPSYQVSEGDVITLREKSKNFVAARKTAVVKPLPSWLAFNEKNQEGKIASQPLFALDQQPLNMQLIIEFYSR